MDSPLVNKLEEMQPLAPERMKKMVEKLHALGLNGVDFDEVVPKRARTRWPLASGQGFWSRRNTDVNRRGF